MQEQIDVVFFDLLEFVVDGFCNYMKMQYFVFVEEMLVDKVQLFVFIMLEMMVFVGGMCVLDINYDQFQCGVFMDCLGMFFNDFFVNVLDLSIKWKVVLEDEIVFEGCDCKINEVKWIGMCVDFIFGFNMEFCVIVEVYGCQDGEECFVYDFIVVWNKVMNVDCFELK